MDNKSLNRLLNRYKRDAKERGYSFELTKKEFIFLTSKDCIYCDKPPLQIVKTKNENLLYNGIDRIDNDKGYFWENCVPSCKGCNLSKKGVTEKIIDKMIIFLKLKI